MKMGRRGSLWKNEKAFFPKLCVRVRVCVWQSSSSSATNSMEKEGSTASLPTQRAHTHHQRGYSSGSKERRDAYVVASAWQAAAAAGLTAGASFCGRVYIFIGMTLSLVTSVTCRVQSNRRDVSRTSNKRYGLDGIPNSRPPGSPTKGLYRTTRR
jgi:hypothetical protein